MVVMKKAYKLVRLRKDKSLGSLFINRKVRLPIGIWMESEDHPTKGYAHRPGWHVLENKHAPHLSTKGRVWCVVEIDDFETMEKPKSQGGVWYLAKRMKIIDVFLIR